MVEQSGTDDETRLRELLERAVPRLPSPPAEQRMLRVRRRVRRGRRLRVAGVTGVTAVALVGAGLGWMTHTAGSGKAARGVPPAASSPGGVHGTDSPPPTPWAPRGARVVTFPLLSGLTVRLPADWATVPSGAPDARATPAVNADGESLGFAGSRPMPVPKSPCATEESYCIPLSSLGEGEGLIRFQVQRSKAIASKVEQPGLRAITLTKPCQAAGGAEEMMGWRLVGPSDPDAVVLATACLNRPSATDLKRVMTVLSTATFAR